MRVLFPKLVQLVIGAIIGAILGGIITGDENYIVWISVGVPILITIAVIVTSVAAAGRRKDPTAPGPGPGINATMPGAPATAQTEAVLNPVSTAQPSAGVVLNGEPMGSPTAAATGARPATATTAHPLRRALGILTIAAGTALVLIPSYSTIAWIGQDIAAGRPFDGRDMRTGLHQQEAFDSIVAMIGSTEVTGISFFNDSIAVTAPTSPGSRSVDRWVYQYGRASHQGPDYSQPDDVRDELFDAGVLDMSLVAKLTRDSVADSDIEDVDGVYPSISRFAGDDPTISISISGAYFSAYYDYTTTGELIQRSGSAFE